MGTQTNSFTLAHLANLGSFIKAQHLKLFKKHKLSSNCQLFHKHVCWRVFTEAHISSANYHCTSRCCILRWHAHMACVPSDLITLLCRCQLQCWRIPLPCVSTFRYARHWGSVCSCLAETQERERLVLALLSGADLTELFQCNWPLMSICFTCRFHCA